MMEAVSVTEELEAHPLINNMKEREKNNFILGKISNIDSGVHFSPINFLYSRGNNPVIR